MNRTKIVAGNWKMNKTFDEGLELAQQITNKAKNASCKVVMASPYIHLHALRQVIGKSDTVFLAAQNCHHETKGAYTGEISVEMLKSIGVDYVLVGHSERRAYNQEDHKMLAKKVNLVLQAGLKVIFCCGEPLTVRQDNAHIQHVKRQLRESLFHLYESEFDRVVIAYEPVWAIGTGETASPEQAQEMHKAIRRMVENSYSEACAQATTLLYGGSCKPSNAKELFSQPDVDGGLIGGASLKADDFMAIINSI